jgi:bifunctional non-homologous end joining protein LigD
LEDTRRAAVARRVSSGRHDRDVPDDRLTRYRAMRDFSKTPEPDAAPTDVPPDEQLSFVVQKHAARALHYDFRLEVDGTMPSWAVPKGPSYDPKVKRMAVHVEDHPLDYREFEGRIPSGEYGGGAVIVWDEGTYRNITGDADDPTPMPAAIEKGHVSIWLDGTKLHGGWSLTRTGPAGERERWILVKRKDEHADPDLDIAAREPRSARTGRTLEELQSGEQPSWTRERATWSPPMLATLARALPGTASRDEWLLQPKLDGLRVVAVRNGDEVELWSRGHQPYTQRFPEIVAALRGLAVDNFTLDGEVVAFAGDRSSFSLLQAVGSEAAAVFAVFDVLHLLGQDTRDLPYADRYRLLQGTVEPGAALQVVDVLSGDPARLLERACSDGWEGLVAKRAAAPYRSGRSDAWLKLKCSASQELVIGGFTEPHGGRRHLGALLVGYHDEHGALRYAGKVGTGFSDATLEDLASRFASSRRAEPPFVDAPRMRDAHWVEPDLVANVVFAEWTPDGKLRHPRFAGLRTDKPARDVVREVPKPAP